MKLIKETALAFDDVHIIPQFSSIDSRKEINLSVSLKNTNITLDTPIIASPMDTVASSKMAEALYKYAGGLTIIHRYNSIDDQATEVWVAAQMAPVGAAVGVNGDYVERAEAAVKSGAQILCVDTAHGHSTQMKEALQTLRQNFPQIHLMAGNVATLEGFNDLSDWGADSVRIGIGSGSICSTRLQTGHGVPLLQSLIDISKSNRSAQKIADGGFVHYGDCVKAIAAGADFIMTGRLLAGTDETPGEIIEEKGPVIYKHDHTADKNYGIPIQPQQEIKKFKTYRGMASKESQIEWRGFHSSNEGISARISYRGPVKPILEDFKNALRSGLSYSGALNIKEFQEKAILTQVSHASTIEATTHIMRENGK